MAKKKKYIKKTAAVSIISSNEVTTSVPSHMEQINALTRQIEQLQNNLVVMEKQYKTSLQHERQLNLQLKSQDPLHEQLRERFVELAILTKELESKEQKLLEAHSMLRNNQLKISDTKLDGVVVKRSLSWRLTKPIRWAIKRVKRRNVQSAAKVAQEMRVKRLIAGSELFDSQWYMNSYPDVLDSKLEPIQHFLEIGCDKGYRPNKNFDPTWYLSTYPDVRNAEFNPLVHYILHGKGENRQTQA